MDAAATTAATTTATGVSAGHRWTVPKTADHSNTTAAVIPKWRLGEAEHHVRSGRGEPVSITLPGRRVV